MNFFQWLSSGTISSLIFIAISSILLLAIILFYVVAFFQGREITFWRPKIGEKPSQKKTRGNIPQLDDRELSSTDYLAPLMDKDKSRGVEQNLLLSIPSDSETSISLETLIQNNKSNSTEILRLASLLTFLRDLGLITIDDKLDIRPVSVLASCFLHSMGLHLKQGLDFIGGWQAHGRDNPEAQRPREILGKIEERRIRVIPPGKAEPIRQARSALVLLKAKYGKEYRYLMQWTESWKPGRYWFLGGVMETKDESIEKCAYRELTEELNITEADVESLQSIGRKIKDLRISLRLGAYTEYEYNLFYALLRTHRQEVRDLFHLKSKIKTFGHDFKPIERDNLWRTWDEIANDPILQRDAGVILDELEKIVDSIPPSSNQIINE